MKLDIQKFGGRGASSSKNSNSTSKKKIKKISMILGLRE